MHQRNKKKTQINFFNLSWAKSNWRTRIEIVRKQRHHDIITMTWNGYNTKKGAILPNKTVKKKKSLKFHFELIRSITVAVLPLLLFNKSLPQPSYTYLLLLFAFHLYRQSASAVIRRMKCEYILKVIKKRSPYITHIEVRIVRQHDGKINTNVIFLNKTIIKDHQHCKYDLEHYVFIGFICVLFIFSRAFHTFACIL